MHKLGLRFWGTRGSLPVALTAAELEARMAAAVFAAQGQRFTDQAEAQHWLRESLAFSDRATYGGASSCVEVVLPDRPDEYLVLDAGSGLRGLGHHILKRQQGRPATIHIVLSHPHWDHIMGFPFFTPIYLPGYRVIIHGGHSDLEAAFRRQHAAPSFPVDFSQLASSIEFRHLDVAAVHHIAGLEVRLHSQLHAGDSYGYRLSLGGRSVVYSTDSEHKLEDLEQTEAFVRFFKDADIVVFDAMYSLADAISVKADWGHSSNIVGVELCQRAGVQHLVLFHHEPMYSDARIDSVLADTQRFEEITREEHAPLRVSAAYDGLELELDLQQATA